MERRKFLKLLGYASLLSPLISSAPALSQSSSSSRAINLKFIADPKLVAWCSLSDLDDKNYLVKESTPVISAFQQAAYKKDAVACACLKGRALQSQVVHSSFAEMGKRVDALLATMVEDDTFKPVLAQTQEAAHKTETEWLADYNAAYAAMKDITGIDLKRDVNVYLVHPAHHNGENAAGDIFWSYRTDFPHYNTVYMWHELLHIIFSDGAEWYDSQSPRYHGPHINDVVEHAIIELCTDHELRKRLGGQDYPPFIGHNYLRAMETKIYPDWVKYLATPRRNIRDFIQQTRSQNPE